MALDQGLTEMSLEELKAELLKRAHKLDTARQDLARVESEVYRRVRVALMGGV